MRPFQQGENWRSGFLGQAQIAKALNEDPAMLGDLFNCDMVRQARRSEAAGNEPGFDLSSAMRTNMAIIHALWRQTGLPPDLAGQLVACWPGIGESVAGIVDFEEADPVRFFDPTAAEAIPVAAVDEYIDIIDGRHFLWRRPQHDPLRIAADLLAVERRLSDDPQDAGAQAEFLATLARLREPASHEGIWLGLRDGGQFRPTPVQDTGMARLSRGAEDRPRSPQATLEMNYRTKISVNISLAARSMKRRALGLAVTCPGAFVP